MLPLILVMEDDMTPLKEIRECVIGAGEREYFFRPSFRNMTRIGEPGHIVRTFYALLNDDVAKMLKAAREQRPPRRVSLRRWLVRAAVG